MIQDLALLVHGINPDLIPGDSIEALDGFFTSLRQDDQHLAARFPAERVIPIRWGHPQQGQPDEGKSFSSDEQLFVAQNRILQAMASVEPRLTADDYLPWSRAQVALGLQRNLLVSGFGDMVYCTGRDGYRTIQRIMFRALRQRIEQLLSAGSLAPNDRIRLHLFAESLGVSISFEFLALLFGPPLVGHQLDDVLEHDDLTFFLNAAAAQPPRFLFGTFVAAASQLPLMLQRRQHAIEQLARDGTLNPIHIGITASCTCPRWLLFHDPRDILSLPTKPLFGDCPWIQEEWVENKVTSMSPADRFVETHNGYWYNSQVLASTRALLRRTCELD